MTLADQLALVVREQGGDARAEDLAGLARELACAVKRRRRVVDRLRRTDELAPRNIFRLMMEARAQDLDEATWRGFLAVHFGCHPLDPPGDDGAGRLLCGFGDAPMWTWARVSADLDGFDDWLRGRRSALGELWFGNHRKFESPRPEHLYKVLGSFVAWIHRRGGSPRTALATLTAPSPEAAFGQLYAALSGVHRLGRLGRFDFLCLLRDAGILNVQPDSCYLRDATGPLAGARRVWGKHRRPRELARLADDLAGTLCVGMDALEDALCIWQKRHPDPVLICAAGRWTSTLPVLQDAAWSGLWDQADP